MTRFSPADVKKKDNGGSTEHYITHKDGNIYTLNSMATAIAASAGCNKDSVFFAATVWAGVKAYAFVSIQKPSQDDA